MMSKSKAAIVVSLIIEKVELVVGGLWTVFFGLVILVSIQDDLLNNLATLIVLLLIGAIGVWMFMKGMKRRKIRLQFEKDVTKLSSDPTAKPVYQSCNCPNCGGINKILKGTVSECDFCGSPLAG
ncbi:hypothetical protein ACR6HW_14710 [Fusibacter sp. JL298sf-3]